MPLLPTAPTRVQPYFGWRNAHTLRLTARALRARTDSFEQSGRWRAFRTMVAQFASHEVGGLDVTLEIARPGGAAPERHTVTTDKEGYARFDIALGAEWPRGERSAWESVRLHWTNRHGAQCTEGHVLAPGTAAGLAVISDIDDTIIETGITGNLRAMLRNWRRVLLDMPGDRLLVPGADVFYSALGGALSDADESRPAEAAGTRHRAPSRPFFYVSSSPWNLFSYLVAYIGGRKLPLGPVLLRDWGANKATFGHASHGAHKRDAIARLLGDFPDLQFAFIGDDTQGDLPAFAEAVSAFPGRVRAVFLRTTGGAFSPEEDAAKAAIAATGVPLWLGKGFDEGQAFLASLGLDGDAEASRVVAQIENAKPVEAAAPSAKPVRVGE